MRYAPTPAEVDESYEIERNNPRSDADAEYRRRVTLIEHMERNYGECRGCKAPVIWAWTERGKKMPVDVDVVSEGPRFLLTVRTGQLIAAYVDRHDQRSSIFGHTSHFATCPQADKHRRSA